MILSCTDRYSMCASNSVFTICWFCASYSTVRQHVGIITEAAIHVLNRYGITAADIYASVNDTTNSAVATGRALANKDGDCMMHMYNLVADHASGKKIRTRQKLVVDQFAECEALRQKTHQMIKFITSKKAKQRMLNYRSRNAEAGKQTIRLGLDNDTRIGGTRRMYEQVLRSRYCIPLYFN